MSRNKQQYNHRADIYICFLVFSHQSKLREVCVIIKAMKTNRFLNMASKEDLFLPKNGIICIGLEVQSCYFCSLSVPAWRTSSKREVERVDSLSLYVLSFNQKWQLGLLVPSYCPQKKVQHKLLVLYV